MVSLVVVVVVVVASLVSALVAVPGVMPKVESNAGSSACRAFVIERAVSSGAGSASSRSGGIKGPGGGMVVGSSMDGGVDVEALTGHVVLGEVVGGELTSEPRELVKAE